MSKKLELIGRFDAASGADFSVFQNERGAFPVFDNKANKPCNPAGSLSKAWDSVRYMAQINPVTGRTDNNDLSSLYPWAKEASHAA